MRNTFVKTLTNLVQNDPKVIVLTADMGFGVFEEFQANFPDRFINTGVAEANTAGIAAGLALSGYTVFFYAQATFATMRCFEQIRLDIASNNLNVKIVGTSAGFNLSQYGVSHYAVEDIALMRLLPNMTVLCPGDLYEAELVTIAAYKIKGPAYIRISRSNSGPDQKIHQSKPRFKIGHPILLSRGKNAALIATGSMLFLAQQVVKTLKTKGLSVSLISMPTVKPINARVVSQFLKNKKIIFTLEEHTIIGGLGSAVIELLGNANKGLRVIALGLQDRFLHVAGTREYLLSRHNLSHDHIVSRILKDIKKYDK